MPKNLFVPNPGA